MSKTSQVVLADGSVFLGTCLFDVDDGALGELVFSTSTTGYAEVLTDPSYYGQIVVMSNPEIGNYGVNSNDFQSDRIKVKGLVLRNLSTCASSFRSQMTLSDWLIREHVPVIFGVDTRKLIAHLRDHGSMTAIISSRPTSAIAQLVDQARSHKTMDKMRLSSFVSVKKAQKMDFDALGVDGKIVPKKRANSYCVVALDFGIKRSIARYLNHFGADLTMLPGDCSLEEIWALKPDGIFLSNGPGDPQTESVAVNTVRALLGKVPIFGVCLGHQILAQALGCSTYKMKFGHRGSNQAVRSVDNKIIATAQNHGFAVKMTKKSHWQELINISDETNEGIDIKDLYAFSVQFHPEGAPGPKDSLFYFEKFMSYIDKWKESLGDDGYAGAHVRRILPLE